jgi:hypothetical protein
MRISFILPSTNSVPITLQTLIPSIPSVTYILRTLGDQRNKNFYFLYAK